MVNGFICFLQGDGKIESEAQMWEADWQSGCMRLNSKLCLFCFTNLDFAGLSRPSLYNLSYTLVMC